MTLELSIKIISRIYPVCSVNSSIYTPEGYLYLEILVSFEAVKQNPDSLSYTKLVMPWVCLLRSS